MRISPSTVSKGKRMQPHAAIEGHREVLSDAAHSCVPRADLIVDGDLGNQGGKASRRSGRENVPGYKFPKAGRLLTERRRQLAASLGVGEGDLVPEASVASFGPELAWERDDRTQVRHSKRTPFRWICHLEIEAWGRRYSGTGWFIGRRTVVTAGHVVYLHGDGGWPRRITVTPALNAQRKPPFGSQSSSSFRTVAAWKNDRDDNFDYGAIVLPDDRLGRQIGHFGYAALTDASLLGTTANLAGYPGDKPTGTQWYHARPISAVTPQALLYAIAAHVGQSGSPVWQLVDGERRVVGIHTGSTSRANMAIRINEEVKRNFDNWADV